MTVLISRPASGATYSNVFDTLDTAAAPSQPLANPFGTGATVPNRLAFSTTNPLLGVNAPGTLGTPGVAPTFKTVTTTKDSLGPKAVASTNPNDVLLKDNAFLQQQVNDVATPAPKATVLGADGKPLIALGPDGQPVPVAPATGPDPTAVEGAKLAQQLYAKFGQGELPAGNLGGGGISGKYVIDGRPVLLSGDEKAPRTYAFALDADGTPRFTRTITGVDFMGNLVKITMPVSQQVYQTEVTGPAGGEAPNARPLPGAAALTNQTALGDTIPPQFQGLPAAAIATMPGGSEFLKVLDAHDTFAATGHSPSEYDRATASQMLSMAGGPEYLAYLRAKAAQIGVTGPAAPIATPTAAGAAGSAPILDRSNIDPLESSGLAAVDKINAISANDPTDLLARQQAAATAFQTEQSGIGLARGGDMGGGRGASPRGVAGLMGQAIGDAAFQTSQASGTNAQLVAQQEEQRRALTVDAQNAISGLGLNAGALDTDVSRLNLDSVSNYLAQQFADVGNKLNIDNQEAERIASMTQFFATLGQSYEKLSSTEQDAMLSDEMTRYGISKASQDAIKAMKAANKFHPVQFLTGLGQAGATAALGALFASDRRAKTDVQGTPDAELEDLLSTVRPYSFKYKDPSDGSGRYLGGMAQDLQKSEVGRSMVQEQPDGKLMVDHGRAGMAALSGLALVYDKLKKIEESL